MPRRKDISNDFRAVVAAHQSDKCYTAISKQSEVHYSTVRKIIHKWKTFKTAASGRPSGVGIPANSPQGHLGLFCSHRTWAPCSLWVNHELERILESNSKMRQSVRQLKLGQNWVVQ